MKPFTNRISFFLPFTVLLFACQETPKTYDRRTTALDVRSDRDISANPSTANQFNDPNDPCGAAKAFGYSLDENTKKAGTYIVGGAAATPDHLAYRSTVKVYVGEGHCTGTLIGPNQVITAAHCFGAGPEREITSASQVSIGFGTSGSPDLNLKVSGILIHPQFKGIFGSETGGYASTIFYDVALITFDGKISDNYYPVVIGSKKDDIKTGTRVIVAGYGAYSEDDRLIRPLSVVETTIGEVLPNFQEIQISVGQGKGACYGDSGGPTYIITSNASSNRSCLKVVGTTTGPGRKSNYTCEHGSGTMMDLTSYQGWIKCSSEQLSAPLSYLQNDESSKDCGANSPIL